MQFLVIYPFTINKKLAHIVFTKKFAFVKVRYNTIINKCKKTEYFQS